MFRQRNLSIGIKSEYLRQFTVYRNRYSAETNRWLPLDFINNVENDESAGEGGKANV